MLTMEQSNYLHSKMREMEEDVRRVLGIDIHFGVYLRSKSLDRMLSHKEAIEKMAKVLSVTLEELKSKDKSNSLTMPRKVIVAVLRACFPSITLVQMGALLERDHTTIINLLNRATDLTNTEDTEFTHLFEIAKKSIEVQ